MLNDFSYLTIDSLDKDKRAKNPALLCHGSSDSFKPGDYFLFPQGKRFKVKRITQQKQNWILDIKGIPLAACKKGNILIPAESGVIPIRDLACHSGRQSDIKGTRFSLRNNQIPSLYKNMAGELSGSGRVKRIVFKRAIPFIPGLHLNTENSGILILLFPWPDTSQKRADMFSYWNDKKHPHQGLIYKYLLNRDGVVKVPAGYKLSVETQQVSNAFGSWYLKKRFLVQFRNNILRRCEKPGGILLRELKEQLDCDPEIIDSIVRLLQKEKLLEKKEGFLISLRKKSREKLSPFDKNILQKCIDAGEAGLPLGAVRQVAQLESYRAMERMGLCHMNGEIILADEYFQKIKNEIIKIRKKDPDMDLTGLKREIPLNRRILVAVLDWMDEE